MIADFRVTSPNVFPSFSPRSSKKVFEDIYIEIPYKEYHPPPKNLDEFLIQHQDEFIKHILNNIPDDKINKSIKNKTHATFNINTSQNPSSTYSLLQTLPPLSPVKMPSGDKLKHDYTINYNNHPKTHPYRKDYKYKGEKKLERPKWIDPANHYYFHPIESQSIDYNNYYQTLRQIASYPSSPIKLNRIDPEYIYYYNIDQNHHHLYIQWLEKVELLYMNLSNQKIKKIIKRNQKQIY